MVSIARMPFNKILAKMEKPVSAEVLKKLVTHMKAMPDSKEDLVMQCAMHLEDNHQSLSSVLAVVHALNDGDLMLRLSDEDAETELASEFDDILGIDDVKK